MIGYFVMAGDVYINDIFQSYKNNYDNILKKITLNKTYDNNLSILLIEYYIEGEFLKLIYDDLRLKPYRKIERSIAVFVPVRKEFLDLSEFQRKEFITETTIKSVKLAIEYLLKKKIVDSKINKLIDDIDLGSKYYLGDFADT